MFNFAGRLVLNATVVTGNASQGDPMSAGGGIASGTVQNGPAGTVKLRATTVIRNAPDNCEPLGTIPGCTG